MIVITRFNSRGGEDGLGPWVGHITEIVDVGPVWLGIAMLILHQRVGI